jgi:hypothetical protein
VLELLLVPFITGTLMWDVLTGDLLERLEDLMGNVAILSAEMATLTRQHAACEFLLGAAEEPPGQLRNR